MANPFVHLELNTPDIAKAKAFYGALFGWDVNGFNLPSILVAFLGAVLFLLILRAIPGTQPFER